MFFLLRNPTRPGPREPCLPLALAAPAQGLACVSSLGRQTTAPCSSSAPRCYLKTFKPHPTFCNSLFICQMK